MNIHEASKHGEHNSEKQGKADGLPNRVISWGRHFGEAIIVVCTFVLAITALWQLWLMQDTARKQLRAYTTAIKSEVIGINTSGPMRVRISIRNSGQTPAYQASIEELYVWWQERKPLAGAMPIKKGIHATLASGEEIWLEHEINQPRRKELRDKTVELHASGELHYKDIYGTQHRSSFHFVQGGEYDPQSPYMGLAGIGNESD